MPRSFNSTQEFLGSNQLFGHVELPERDHFIAEVCKASTHARELRELTQDDVDNGTEPNTLLIKLVNNQTRHWNVYEKDTPPPGPDI